jgi:hypothetical protein
MTQARKGDLVALETTRVVHYVNPYRSEASSEWTIVRVASASREGIVKAIENIGYGLVQKLAHITGNPRVHTLGDHQQAAERLIASLGLDQRYWTSADALRAAILGA